MVVARGKECGELRMNILWNGVDRLRLMMGLGDANYIGKYTSSSGSMDALLFVL
jgi:hypothetical protein